MNRENLIEFCKYYKGEESPKSKDYNIESLWNLEKMFVDLMSDTNGMDKVIYDAIDDYVSLGLSSFMSGDGIPKSFKAFYFNRYTQSNGRIDTEGWKQAYMKYYK